jgi:chemotaxis protein CheD
MIETIRVGISEVKVTEFPNKLRTAGLGSCVGIVLYDRSLGYAGMAHAMLPDHTIFKNATLQFPGKYVDTAIQELLKELRLKGSHPTHLKAKLAGGAEMFKFTDRSMARIGERNIQASKSALDAWQIPLVAEETGGQFGRTIEFDITTSKLHIRTASQGELDI